MELSIAFIVQYFPSVDDLYSPLTHFTDIMGISNRLGRFNEPYNYTSCVAGLIWMCRLLTMEYALPSREYITLGWRSHEAYYNGILVPGVWEVAGFKVTLIWGINLLQSYSIRDWPIIKLRGNYGFG